MYYQGVIEEFDTQSGRHRVQYSDSEWEFINLKGEGYIVHVPPERLTHLISVIHAESEKATTCDGDHDSGNVASRKRLKRKSTS